jgi:hypothetical protein
MSCRNSASRLYRVSPCCARLDAGPQNVAGTSTVLDCGDDVSLPLVIWHEKASESGKSAAIAVAAVFPPGACHASE